ncbi:MAG: TonB family protein [Pseudomonadota bacterium]
MKTPKLNETQFAQEPGEAKSRKTDGISLLASLCLHLVLFALLSSGFGEKALLMSSIKGSPDAGSVMFDVLKAPEEHSQEPTPEIKKDLTVQDSDVAVASKKNVKPALALKPKKAQPQREEKTKSLAESSSSSRPGSSGPLGFDLQNIKGNLSPELQKYFTKLRMDIERRKKYPKLAKRLRQSGRVVLKFEIGKSGKIVNVFIEEPSPYKSLNDSARKLLSNLKGEYPLPSAIKSDRIEVKLPVSYKL